MKHRLSGILCACLALILLWQTSPDAFRKHADALGYIVGDVDGDARITAADARLVLRYSVRLEQNWTIAAFAAADVDNDGLIAAADARLILRRSVSLIDSVWPAVLTGDVTFQSVFKDACFVGDSIIESVVYYNHLAAPNAYGRNGAGLSYLEEMLPTVIAAKPRYVILHFGMNMLSTSEQYLQNSFIGYYAELCGRLAAALPGVKITVSSLFPITADAQSRRVEYAYRTNYNAALKSMCAAHGWRYLDNEALVNANLNYLSADGMHPLGSFYDDIWLHYVRSETGVVPR